MLSGRKLLVIAGLALVASLILSVARYREPRCDGHSLSYWLARGYWHGWRNLALRKTEVDPCIRQIGTNALPFLLHRIQWEATSPWRRKLAQKVREYRQNPVSSGDPLALRIEGHRREDLANEALYGFEVLAEIASPAVPELTRLATDLNHSATPYRAIKAAAACGTNGLPVLAAVLAAQPNLHQPYALKMFGAMNGPPAPTNYAIPAVLLYLEETNSEPRARYASEILAFLQTNNPAH